MLAAVTDDVRMSLLSRGESELDEQESMRRYGSRLTDWSERSVLHHPEISSGGSDRSNPLKIAMFLASVAAMARIWTSDGSTG